MGSPRLSSRFSSGRAMPARTGASGPDSRGPQSPQRRFSSSEAAVTQAYRDVLGRDPDPDGLAVYKKAYEQRGIDFVYQSLAASPEGRRRGARPEMYGAKPVDVSALSGELRPYYEAWAARHPGQVFTDYDLASIKEYRRLYSPAAYRQVLAGNVIESDGFVQITPQAVFALADFGNEVADLSRHFYGANAGVSYLYPTNIFDASGRALPVRLGGKNFTEDKMLEINGQRVPEYHYVTALGNQTSGLFGALGWDSPVKDLSKVVGKTGVGVLNTALDVASLGMGSLVSSAAFGSRGRYQLDTASASVTGMGLGTYQKARNFLQLTGKTALQTVLAPTGVGPFAVEGVFQAAKATETAALGGSPDVADAVISTAFAAAPGSSAWAVAAKNAMAMATSQAIDNFDVNAGRVRWRSVAEGAIASGVGQALGARPNEFGLNGGLFPQFTQGGVNWATVGLRAAFADTAEARRGAFMEGLAQLGSNVLVSGRHSLGLFSNPLQKPPAFSLRAADFSSPSFKVDDSHSVVLEKGRFSSLNPLSRGAWQAVSPDFQVDQEGRLRLGDANVQHAFYEWNLPRLHSLVGPDNRASVYLVDTPVPFARGARAGIAAFGRMFRQPFWRAIPTAGVNAGRAWAEHASKKGRQVTLGS